MKDHPISIFAVKQMWQFLGDLAWPRSLVNGYEISTRYKGHFGEMDVNLCVNNGQITMMVDPLLNKPAGIEWGNCVQRVVESLHKDIRAAQIGIDKKGDIYIKVTIPENEIQFERFAFILISLCEMSEELTLPLLQANVYDKFERTEKIIKQQL